MTGCMIILDFCQIPLATTRLRATLVAFFVATFCIVEGRETLRTHTEQERSLQSGLSKGSGVCPRDVRDASVFNQQLENLRGKNLDLKYLKIIHGYSLKVFLKECTR